MQQQHLKSLQLRLLCLISPEWRRRSRLASMVSNFYVFLPRVDVPVKGAMSKSVALGYKKFYGNATWSYNPKPASTAPHNFDLFEPISSNLPLVRTSCPGALNSSKFISMPKARLICFSGNLTLKYWFLSYWHQYVLRHFQNRSKGGAPILSLIVQALAELGAWCWGQPCKEKILR